ncbi:MAG: antibiotic biosynthesis monooxygenase family protein [Bacteroidia bacterium]|nr:antibiotic biosynthesis monooxygenase [Bacteroidia bacterium]MDW8134537.1 antibiotic biosynthesis monooxygenase family protein [Bacteroidia bacterium]
MGIWRWVEIPVAPEKEEETHRLLLRQASQVRSFPGCRSLALYRSVGPNFYSLSLWESEEALEKYRSSRMFRDFWAQIKPFFRAPAKAMNLILIEECA